MGKKPKENSMIDLSELKSNCQGKWFSLLSDLGIVTRTDGRHEPCPHCGGIDRFRMEKDGSGHFCNQCGAGDTIALIQKVKNWTFKETCEYISERIGGVNLDKIQTSNNQLSIDKIKNFLNSIWNDSVPLTGGDYVSKYLHTRKLVLRPHNVRYCKECYETDTKQKYPAMVARIQNKEGIPIALHRTYLDKESPQKADIESPKKLTPATEHLSGSAIRLFPVKDKTLGIAEGIETAIACTQMFDIPTWATISTSIMEGFDPPDGVRKIIIFADNDGNYAGQKSAYILANKLYNRDFIVEVRIPEQNGQDFNDFLMRV